MQLEVARAKQIRRQRRQNCDCDLKPDSTAQETRTGSLVSEPASVRRVSARVPAKGRAAQKVST